MLDYYFCEECQTYHQPNRLINGEILSACQCQISTQSGASSRSYTNDIGSKTKQKNKNFIQKQIIKEKIHPTPILRIQSPTLSQRTQTSTSPVFNSRHSAIPYSNLPFLAIATDQNKQNMKRIILQRSPIKQQPLTRVISPLTTNRQGVSVKISMSPVIKPVQYQIQPITPINQFIKIQQIKPTQISIKTPIQTINNLVFPKSSQIISSNSKTNVSIQNPPSFTQIGSAKIIKNIQQSPNIERNRVTLDRVSGQKFGEYDKNYLYPGRADLQRVIEDRQYVGISLDRVIQQKDVIAQSDQKDECCGKMCYY